MDNLVQTGHQNNGPNQEGPQKSGGGETHFTSKSKKWDFPLAAHHQQVL